MSNVKAGDLAILVPPACRNVGRIVEIMRAVPMGNFIMLDGALAFNEFPALSWEYRFVGGSGRLLSTHGRILTLNTGFALDTVLRPLPGDTEDTTAEREVTA